jgi:hypothetical protein
MQYFPWVNLAGNDRAVGHFRSKLTHSYIFWLLEERKRRRESGALMVQFAVQTKVLAYAIRARESGMWQDGFIWETK